MNNKNSLASILFEKNLQKALKMNREKGDLQQKIFGNSQLKQNQRSSNYSNKMIKITQFNSPLLMTDQRFYQNNYKTNYSASPQKNFNIKKINEFKAKVATSAHKIVEIQLKKKQRGNKDSHRPWRREQHQDQGNEHIKKVLVTSKLTFKNEAQTLRTQINDCTPTVIFMSRSAAQHQTPPLSHLQISEQIVFAAKSTLVKSKNNEIELDRQGQEAEKIRKKEGLKIQTIVSSLQGNNDAVTRKYSASPRKNYGRHIDRQKNYQQNIQRERRQILEMKKQLNKNYAKPFSPPENITAAAYLIYEADAKRNGRKFSAGRQNDNQIRKVFLHSNQVVVSLNSRTAFQIASLTKIMTCIVALDLSQSLKLNLSQEQVTVGAFQSNIGGTSADIKKGDIYNIEQLLYGLMLPSGNDASLAIAVWAGRILLNRQNQERKYKKRQCLNRFIQEMNAKANNLGMEKTRYCNSHGLSNTDNKSCAYDIGILSQYAMNNQFFRRIVSCKVYQTQIRIDVNQVNLENQKNRQQNQQTMPPPLVKGISKDDSKKSIKKRISGEGQQDGKYDYEQLKDLQYEAEHQNIQGEQQEDNQLQNDKKMMVRVARWQNTHQLVQCKSNLYKGIKTGVTTTAGPCLSSCIEIANRRFIIVVLNCKSMKYRFKDTEVLRKWLFTKEGIQEKQCDKKTDYTV